MLLLHSMVNAHTQLSVLTAYLINQLNRYPLSTISAFNQIPLSRLLVQFGLMFNCRYRAIFDVHQFLAPIICANLFLVFRHVSFLFQP